MDLNALMGALGPIQEKVTQANAERSAKQFVGNAGGGAIKVSMSGDLQVSNVEVASAAAAAVGDDPTMLEDLLQVAINDCLNQYKAEYGATPDEQLQKMFAGSGLGSMLGPLMGGMS